MKLVKTLRLIITVTVTYSAWTAAFADGSGDDPWVVEPIIITGGGPSGDYGCGVSCSAPGTGSNAGGGGGSPGAAVAAAQKALAIKTIYQSCQKAGESQYDWLARQVQNCITDALAHLNTPLVLGCKAAGEDLIPAAASGSLTPPPSQC
jgi:hypothetical protein